MRQYIDVLQDNSGNAVTNGSVVVRAYPSGTLASIYSDNGLTPIGGSSVATDATGAFSFFAADGDYTLQLFVNGLLSKTQSPVSIFDGAAQLTYPDSGAVNAYVITDSALEKALRTGLRASIKITNTNTGASTLQYNGLAAKPITIIASTPVPAGALVAGGIYRMEYDGTQWQLPSSLLTQSAIGSVLYPRTAAEIAAGVTPTAFYYPSGDPRRSSFYTNQDWFDYGDVGTFISATSFSIPGDVTARYPVQRYLQIRDSSAGASIGRITNAVFAAGVTTFTLSMETGTISNPVAGVFLATGIMTDYPLGMSYDINGIPTGPLFWNKSNGAGGVSRLIVASGTSGTGSDVGLAIVAIQNSYGSFPYISGAPSGRQIVLHTGVSAPITIGVFDVAKVTFTVGNSPTRFYTDVEVNNNQTGATLSNLIIDGTTGVSRLTLKNSGTERGFLVASNTGPEILFGTNSALDVSFVYNGTRVLTLNGANSTGGSTPTLSANKPGANAGVITWLSVKNGAGTQGWMPIFGN